MTELEALLTFLLNLPRYVGQQIDVSRLARRLRTILAHDDQESLVALATNLLRFDDAVVVGLNSGKFQIDSTLSLYPRSVLPRFLYGLSSRIFESDGTLKGTYDVFAVDALLTALRLVRRCSIKSQSAEAEKAGVTDFISAQTAPSRQFDEVIADSMSVLWSELLDDPTRDITLGFPGSGVTSDMRFPYVPRMSFVDPSTVPHPIRGYMVRAVDRFLPNYFEVTSDCDLIQVYPYLPYPERICKLVTVPKSFLTDRAITITNTSSVIIGATLRETIWTAARYHGLKEAMNVHDQKRSHGILYRFFNRIACLDLKGGSTCFTVEQQLHYFRKSRFATNMFNFSRPSFVRYKKEEPVEVRTLTMGDASCTALLTTNLAFFVLLAVARKYLGLLRGEVFPAAMWHTVLQFVREEGILDLFGVVGDDVIIPEEIYDEFVEICLSQGVIINARKSSVSTSNHKETCGAWGVRIPVDAGIPVAEDFWKIYPFRARTSSKDLVTSMSAVAANFGRVKNSRFAIELMIANSAFSHQIEYLNTEGYHESDIGSPIGTNPFPRTINPCTRKYRTVPDDIACAFGCADSRIDVRESKRPILQRGRITKYRDRSAAARVTVDNTQGSSHSGPQPWDFSTDQRASWTHYWRTRRATNWTPRYLEETDLLAMK